MPRKLSPAFKFVLCLGLLTHFSGQPAAEDVEFQPELGFLKLPEGWEFGSCSAVAVNRQGEIYVFHRGKHPLMAFDATGRYLRAWGDDLVRNAHGLRVDREDNIWATDIGGHRVFKFDPTGKLLLALGSGKPGTDDDQFNKPTDVAFGNDGEVFVTDGYNNTRVMKFAASGKLLLTWGSAGKGPGEFNLPHSIVIDVKGRVLVGDRENDRIQVFDQEAQLLEIWPGFAPYGMALDNQGVLYVADARANKILRLDGAGKVQQSWGMKGQAPGEFNLPHMLAFDAHNNLFIAEVDGKRFQKLIRK